MLRTHKYISVRVNESELRGRNGVLSFLLEMSNFLSTSMDLKELLTGALSKVLEYFHLEAGRVYFIDDGEQSLGLAACQGIDPGGLEKININGSFSGKAVLTKSFIALHVSELEDRKRSALLSGKGFKFIICAPLMVMDRVSGVMNLAASEMIKLDQGDIDLLTTLGNQIAVAANHAKLYGELRRQMELLKEKKEMIKFFAYSVSHDLRSPAIGIHGLTQRLREKYQATMDEKGRAYCDQILKTSAQMVALAEEINAFIRTKEAPLNFEKINVKEITELIRNEFSALMDQRQINWSEPEILPGIVADKLALARAFRNLVDNALKYGGEKLCRISIQYEESKDFHIFSFEDDGVGIKPENKEKIFEMFQRVETSNGTPGSGLGLSIVKEIAKSHGGTVWVDSGTQKGATFLVSISKDVATKN